MVNDTQILHTEREIHRLMARKQTAEQHIATLEARLYDLETEYLRETAGGHGSLLKSLDGYHGLKPTTTNGNNTNSHKRFTDEERIFSRTSSHSYKHSVRLYRAASGHHQDDNDVDMHLASNDDLYFANSNGNGDNTDNTSVISSTGGSPKRKKSSHSSGSHKKRVRK